MKIVHVCDSLYIGGAEKLIHDLTIQQKNAGYDVKVVSLIESDTFLAQDLRLLNIDVSSVWRNEKQLYNPLSIVKLGKLLKDADIIHVHLFPANYWIALYKKFFNPRATLLITEHSTNNKRRNKWILKPVEKFIYEQYNKIIGCSQAVSDNLNKFLNINSVVTIENGIDTLKFLKAKSYDKRELLGEKYSNAIIIMMTARFFPPKDQNTVIKALSYLDENVVAVFVGSGDKIDDSKAYATKLGVENRCFFLGLRKDVDRLVNTADINILSSAWEGLSLSSVECMSAKKPFIGSNVKGIKEIVEGAGMLFDFQDAKGLAKCIKEVMNHSNQYKYYSESCFERAKQFDIRNTFQKYDRIYKSLVEN